jgi:hypothetical protein
MKILPFLAALALTSLVPLSAAPPAVGIEQALKLATDYLADRGLSSQHYIGSLTLEDSSLTGGERFWLARWVPAIRADERVESGLQIRMDGSLARITTGGPGSPSAARSDAAGQRRVGARNIR